jgi:hypothetical protein
MRVKFSPCALILAAALIPASLAQRVKRDPIPLKNWPVSSPRNTTAKSAMATATAPSGLLFIAVTPCRVADTRVGSLGSGKTGKFGPPELVGFLNPTVECR